MSLTASGCSPSDIVLVDDDRRFTREDTARLLDELEPPTSVTEPGDVTQRRRDALADLRREGGTGNRAANLITRSFPPDTRGVPFYVERAEVGGEPAWLVIEAIGPSAGRLDDERLWVLTDDGGVLFSATR